MKIYLAAKFQEKNAMRAWREVLQRNGFEVVARWIDSPNVNDGDLDEIGQARAAEECLEDLEVADVVMLWHPKPQHGRGVGKHIEFGYAVARGKRLILVGERESVFHYLGEVHVVPYLEAALGLLSAMQTGAS